LKKEAAIDRFIISAINDPNLTDREVIDLASLTCARNKALFRRIHQKIEERFKKALRNRGFPGDEGYDYTPYEDWYKFEATALYRAHADRIESALDNLLTK
jgi:hypothetical protein